MNSFYLFNSYLKQPIGAPGTIPNGIILIEAIGSHSKNSLCNYAAIILISLILLLQSGTKVMATNYYSSVSGTPSFTYNWWTGNDGTGIHPANFTNAADNFIIQTGDIMTANVVWTVVGTITINNGGTLTRGIQNITCGALVINGTNDNSGGGSFTINGNVSGTGTISAGNIARVFNVTKNWTFSGTVTSRSNIALMLNGTGDQTLSGTISQTGSSQACTLTINKSSGSVILESNVTTAGRFTLTAGTFDASTFLFTVSGTRTFTAGTMRVGATTWAGNYSFIITEPAAGNIEYYRAGDQTVNAVSHGGNLTLSGSDNKTVTGVSVTGNLIMNSSATVIPSATFTVSGSTILNGTTILTLGAADILAPTPIDLNGGTFKTGATNGYSETVGTLQLSANSTIALGTGSHILTLANSSAVSWTGTSLTITGWTGTVGASGTAGKIFVGVGGLSTPQLAKVSFSGYTDSAIILGTGELVPATTVPVLAISGSSNHGSACVFTPGAIIQYTISNTGNAASGITVVSNNAQFVVSSLSSNNIAGNGGIATYNVTFTPASVGAQSATITVASTTFGSNLPTSLLLGTGLNSTPIITTQTSALFTSTSASLGGNITALGCTNVTERGIYWSTTTGFANGAGTKVSETAGPYPTGVFTIPVSGLAPNTVYNYKAFATNTAGSDYSTQGTFTTLCSPIGDPAVFGDNIWNVYGYNGMSVALNGTTYLGYYTESAMSFNSSTQWDDMNSPSSATGYQGCPVNIDNFTFVSKRKGFPYGTYQIDIPSHDDDVRLLVNGTQVFEHIGCCDAHLNVWTGELDANSTIELRIANGTANCMGALTFTLASLQPSDITGSTAPCQGSSQTYSVTPVTDVTYTWTLPAGWSGSSTTSSITVIAGSDSGVISVTPSNTSGSGITRTLAVIPTIPPITNGVTICQGESGLLTSSTSYTTMDPISIGPNNAGTGANVIGVGTVAWSTPGSITTVGAPYATITLSNSNTSNYLQGSDYGFAIPTGATINGIKVVINRLSSNTTAPFIQDSRVSLVKAGVIQTTNYASTGTNWTNSLSIATYGGASNLWGTIWTAEEINASAFGVVLSVVNSNPNSRTATVDYMQISVTYTIPVSLNWFTASSGGILIGSGSPFDPVGKTNSGLPDTNTPGTTTFFAECSVIPGCRAAADFVINSPGTWLGGSTDWDTPLNWCGGVPTASTNLTIANLNSHPVISALTAANCNDMVIQEGATLTIESDATSSGSLIVHGASTNTGTVTYNRWLNHNNMDPAVPAPELNSPGFSRWYITSAPVNVTAGFDPNKIKIHQDDMNVYDFATYNELANDWDYVAALPTGLDAGKGYLISLLPLSDGHIQFTGTLNNGDVKPTVTNTGADNGWNAVGNPYTSAIKVVGAVGSGSFLDVNKSNLNADYAAIYLWNETGSYNETQQYYKVIGNSGYKPNGGAIAQLYDDNIQAGQGFLIHSNETSSTVTFNKAMQVHQTGLSLKSAAVSWPGITLLAQSKGQTRSTIVAFNEMMTTGLDVTYDAGLLASDQFQLYTHLAGGSNTVDFAIQCLPDNLYSELTIPVGVNLPQGGDLLFKAVGIILPNGFYPIIEDKLLNLKTFLKTESDSYTVTLPRNTSGTGRFYLSIGDFTSVNPIVPVEKKYTASFINNQITIMGAVVPGTKALLYDISGRKLGEYPLENLNRNGIMVSGFSQRVYLLKIEGKNYSQELKLVSVYTND